MADLLIFIAVILVVIALFQILSIYDLSYALKGEKGYEVTDRESKIQGGLMAIFIVLYFAYILYNIDKWGQYTLPRSASYQGDQIDLLMTITWWTIIPVFIVSHILIGYFCWHYAHDSKRKATYVAHNNKLEFIWTIIPTLVLTFIILYGLKTWNNVMSPIKPNVKHEVIGVYAKQFSWTVRYSGKDNQLGRADIHLITPTNPLGMDTTDSKGFDDKIVISEMHLPVNMPIQFEFRAQDVIHSAYMPYFRAQMNCVPGMTTRFKFTPKYTTAQMRKITKNPKFDYILLCNKVCGAAHYNMKMKIVVDTPKDFKAWLAKQKDFRPNGLVGYHKSNDKTSTKLLANNTVKSVNK